MNTQCVAHTSGAVIWKLALLLPAGTVMLAGVMTWPSILPCRITSAPPGGAGEVSVTVAVDVLPLAMRAGLSVNDERLGGDAAAPGGISVIHACGAR